ncbi:MAG: hypothetical protein RSD49_07990 [Hafnia sp.]
MSKAGKAILEMSQRPDYKFWAKLISPDGTERLVSAYTKLALIASLSDTGYTIEFPELAISDSEASVYLSSLLQAIPESFTIDDHRLPDGYDDHETVIPYIAGANRVIGELRAVGEALGHEHRDAKYGPVPIRLSLDHVQALKAQHEAGKLDASTLSADELQFLLASTLAHGSLKIEMFRGGWADGASYEAHRGDQLAADNAVLQKALLTAKNALWTLANTSSRSDANPKEVTLCATSCLKTLAEITSRSERDRHPQPLKHVWVVSNDRSAITETIRDTQEEAILAFLNLYNKMNPGSCATWEQLKMEGWSVVDCALNPKAIKGNHHE